eukprot:3704166-Pyramimonas_sp.AAC.1
MAPPDGQVLLGPRTPHWGCSCGCADNWASRVACRMQGARQAASRAKSVSRPSGLGPKQPFRQWANGPPGSATSKLFKQLQDLQQQVAKLTGGSRPESGAAPPWAAGGGGGKGSGGTSST